MNINKYYETIKQKLEGIEPSFEDNDWDEMKSFMALNTPKVSFWNNYGRMLLYSSGILLLLTSLFFNIKQNYDYKTLLKTNQILNQKTTPNTLIKERIIVKTDTVYKTKYITRWLERENDSFNNINQTTDNQLVKNKIENIAEQKDSFTENEAKTSVNENQIYTTIQVDANKEKIKYKDYNDATTNSSKVVLSENQMLKDESGGIFKKEENLVLENTKNVSLNIINSIPYSNNQTNWKSNFPIIKRLKMPVDATENKRHFVITLPNISLKNLQYRAGLGFDVGNEQIGGTLLGEALLNKHWGISAGVRLLNVVGKTYYTSQQHDFDTNTDFRLQYASFVPPIDDIINIDFQNYLLQIPLGITYRYPLRNDFTLLFSGGTDLDLFVRQNINFDYKEDNRSFEQGTYKANLTKKLFNNIEFSAGLEKKYKRMIFQVKPFIAPQLKQTIYKNEGLYFGAKMRLFVNLRR